MPRLQKAPCAAIYFDTTMINGVPLRKAEVRETENGCDRDHQGSLCRIDDRQPEMSIGDHRSDADAEKCYRLALEAAACRHGANPSAQKRAASPRT